MKKVSNISSPPPNHPPTKQHRSRMSQLCCCCGNIYEHESTIQGDSHVNTCTKSGKSYSSLERTQSKVKLSKKKSPRMQKAERKCTSGDGSGWWCRMRSSKCAVEQVASKFSVINGSVGFCLCAENNWFVVEIFKWFFSWFLITQEVNFLIAQLLQLFLVTLKRSLNYPKKTKPSFFNTFHPQLVFTLSPKKFELHPQSVLVPSTHRKTSMWFRKRIWCSKENLQLALR